MAAASMFSKFLPHSSSALREDLSNASFTARLSMAVVRDHNSASAATERLQSISRGRLSQTMQGSMASRYPTRSTLSYDAGGGEIPIESRLSVMSIRTDLQEVSEADALIRFDSGQSAVAAAAALKNGELPGEDESSCLSFTESATFMRGVAVVLLANIAALTLETDHPEWPWWDRVNCLFLMAYVIEFLLRLLHRGLMGLLWTDNMRRWRAFELLIICLGVADLSVACCYGVDVPTPEPELDLEGMTALTRKLGQLLMPKASQQGLVRVLMLSRLLRLGRVLRVIKPLFECVNLLMEMQGTFAWILTMIFLFCFVLAIMLTRLIGHGLLCAAGEEEFVEQAQSLFSSIPVSLFTLFQLTTAENWSTIATPVVSLNPMWRLFFVVFITFMSWTMLSLLTAVASETMISFSSNKKEEEKIFQEIQRQFFTTFLCAEFVRADTDGDKELDKEEFTALMSRPSMKEEMRLHGIHLKQEDLLHSWDTFDVNDSGQLSIDELVQGFEYLAESLAMKHVANVNYSLKRFNVRTDSELSEAESDVHSLDEQDDILTRAVARSDRLHRRWGEFTDGLATATRAPSAAPKASQAGAKGSPASPSASGSMAGLRASAGRSWGWGARGRSGASHSPGS